MFCVGVTGSVWHRDKYIQDVPKMLEQISRMSYSQKMKNTCSQIVLKVQPSRSPVLNPAAFFVGTFMVLVYSNCN